MKPEAKVVERKIGDVVFRLESGKVAGLANGAVIASSGETTVLATGTASAPRGDADFFPLTVDVEERMYAAGKIPGGFFRREGKASEKATLLARLIDRPLRPAFPDGFRNEVHVVCTILAVDNVNPMDIVSVNAASAALAISDVPFDGPIGCVRLCHIDNQWKPNPTYEEQEDATIELVVAGRMSERGEVDIMMIEAGGSEHMFEIIEDGATAPDEEILADGIERSKDYIAELISMQNELAELIGKPKAPMGEGTDFPIFVDYSDEIMTKVSELAGSKIAAAISITSKAERRHALAEVGAEVNAALAPESSEEGKQISNAIRSLTKKLVRKRIVEENKRLDGRPVDEVRPIWVEPGAIPRVHGSAIFTRGETQALSIATLGMQRMEQMIDDLSLEDRKRYMHH